MVVPNTVPKTPTGLINFVPQDVSAGPCRPAEIARDEFGRDAELALQAVCPNRVDLEGPVINRPVLVHALQRFTAAALGKPYSD